MTTRRTRELKTGLTGKGFHQEDTHHEMYWFYVRGKRTSVRTRISHGENEYADNLLGQMARQIGLKRREFDDFIDCPISQDAYERLLVERGRIRLDNCAQPG